MNAMLAQMQRGYVRAEGFVLDKLHRVPPARLAAHKAASDELRASTTAFASLAAIPDPTPEQRIGQAKMEEGYELQKANLLRIQTERPWTSEERYQFQHLEQTLADIRMQREGATLATVGAQRLSLFGPVGAVASPWAGILASPMTWAVLAFAVPASVAAVQTARLEHAKHDLADAQRTARQNAQAAASWRERADAYAHATEDAQAAARITTNTLEAERARARAAAARERRRQDELRQVDSGGAPPSWERSLRGDAATPDQSGAPAAAPAGDPGGVRH